MSAKLSPMKKMIVAIIFVSLWVVRASSQTPPRFFDTVKEPHQGSRLTICYPSSGTLKAILALKDQGLLPPAPFELVGIYQAKERTNYKDAQKFVETNKLSWIKFHEVTAQLGPADLFRLNAATKEFKDIFDKSDGLIFFGGPDIPPGAYGQKTSLLTRIEDPNRHYFELSLVFHLLGGSQDASFKGFLETRPNFPVLGICLGMQTLNTGTGGTLVQDVWADTYGKAFVEDIILMGQSNWHTNPWPHLDPLDRKLLPYMLHPIKLDPQSMFCAELKFKPGDEPYIMSAHHQAAGRIGQGFRPAATSLDGKVVEAVEHTRYPHVLGVQFHPEFPMLWDAEPKYKFTPRDKDFFGILAYLKAHPPSFDFHKKLWLWFFAAVQKAGH
jgi:putative glutamine amidotransferase